MSSECKNGARGILLGVKPGNHLPQNGEIPDGIVPICGVLLRDRARKSAPAAVNRLREAGIGVVMVTGDSRETAEAIARECGIIGADCDLVIDSVELSRMKDDEVRAILP
jgi:magnesium-transporting ATPase (P-type)